MIKYCTICKQPLEVNSSFGYKDNRSIMPMYCIECYNKLQQAWNEVEIFDEGDLYEQ